MTQDIDIKNLTQLFSDNQIPTGDDFAQLITLANSTNQVSVVPNKSDLNNIVSTGTYRLDSGSYANEPATFNTIVPGLLTVTVDHINDIIYQQIISSGDNSVFWKRACSLNQWSSWHIYSEHENVFDASSVTDANNLTNTGYYQSFNGNISNMPNGFNEPWFIQVISFGIIYYQHLYGEDGSEYTRINSGSTNGNWSNWNQLPTGPYISSLENSLTSSANSALSSVSQTISDTNNVQGLVVQANSYANSVAKLWNNQGNQDIRNSVAAIQNAATSTFASTSAQNSSLADSVNNNAIMLESAIVSMADSIVSSNASSLAANDGSMSASYTSFASSASVALFNANSALDSTNAALNSVNATLNSVNVTAIQLANIVNSLVAASSASHSAAMSALFNGSNNASANLSNNNVNSASSSSNNSGLFNTGGNTNNNNSAASTLNSIINNNPGISV